MCCICDVEPCVAKFNYCKECKKDVQSCANAAKAEGREDDFKKLAKTNAGLRHLMAHYKAKCPSRGQGVPRDKMDWGAYLASTYTDTHVVTGSREVYMDFPDFEKFSKEKGKSSQEIIDSWAAMESSGLDHDLKGRKDFEKRFPVVVEDYRLKETIKGNREDCTGSNKVLH